MAYFPDNDYASHKVGPLSAVGTIEQFDEFLGHLAHQWGSLPKMLDEVDFVVTGDHSQSETTDDQNRVTYGDYPNALERIASSFDDRRTGALWVTAKLGYAFRLPKTSVHERGGSHGSLHRLDSTVPLIVSAPSEAVCLGEHLRTVDVVAVCQQLLGQTPAIQLGAGRFTPVTHRYARV